MEINLIHEFLLFVISKEQTGHVSHEQLDDTLNRASLWRFNELLKYYAVDQKAQDDLAPFKKKFTFTNGSSTNGLITLPADYLHMLSADTLTYDNEKQKTVSYGIETVNDDEFTERSRSQLDPVTKEKPIARWAGLRKLQLFPKEASVGEIWYLKIPNKAKFSYTQVGRAITYVPSTSIQLEWDEINLNQVMYNALSYLGIKLDFDKLIAYSNQQKQVDA